MSKKINKEIKKPVQPYDSECCQSGCNPCVWDYYYADLDAWRKAVAEKEKKDESQ
jgi:hypothetical protein